MKRKTTNRFVISRRIPIVRCWTQNLFEKEKKQRNFGENFRKKFYRWNCRINGICRWSSSMFNLLKTNENFIVKSNRNVNWPHLNREDRWVLYQNLNSFWFLLNFVKKNVDHRCSSNSTNNKQTREKSRVEQTETITRRSLMTNTSEEKRKDVATW